MPRLRRRHIVLAAVLVGAVALGAAGAVALAVAGGLRSDDDPARHAADLSAITPVPPLTGTRTVPDYSHPTHCQLPEDDRPGPDLPPLSCRNTGAEPSPGAIPTADPAKRDPAPTPEKGYKVIDNQLFRLTVLIPDDWYSNMRPEGGQFAVSDPSATEHAVKHTDAPLGIVIGFAVREYIASAVGLGTVETELESPNTTIADVPGVIIDEGQAEGSRWFRAAFRKSNIVYIMDAYVAEKGRSSDEIQADIDTVNTVLATITTD